MNNKIMIKKISLFFLFILSILGLVLSIMGTNQLFASGQAGKIPLELPFVSQVANVLFWVMLVCHISFLFIFKERKSNILWLILSFPGVVIFSIKTLLKKEIDKNESRL